MPVLTAPTAAKQAGVMRSNKPTNLGHIGELMPSTAAPPSPPTVAPSPSTTTTPVDPMQQNAYNMANDYAAGLADNSNAEITRALSRQRDEISVGMQREGEAAAGRGAGAGLFRSRALESGQRAMNDLHGRLTDVALGRRNEAINTVGNRADSAANTRNTLHLGTMAQALNERRATMEQADQQSRLQQAPYDRLMSMMSMVGQYGSSMLPTAPAAATPNPGLFGANPTRTPTSSGIYGRG